MAITVGNTSNGKITSLETTLTISHTVVSGGDRLLIATVGTSAGDLLSILSATYNGQSMTSLQQQVISSGRIVETFYIKNPPIGTHDIVFTFSDNARAIGCGVDVSGVNLDDNLIFDTIATSSGSGTSNTVSPNSNTTYESDFIYSASFIANDINQTLSDSQTEIVDDIISATFNIGLAVGYKTAVGNVTPIGWSFSSSGYAIHAFAVRAKGVAVLPVSDDTFLRSDTATTNYNGHANLAVGESNSVSGQIYRSLVKPSFSSLPVDIFILDGKFKITPIVDLSSNARTMYMHRVLRAVNFSQTTWNIFSTGNNWGTAGCSNSTTDYDGSVVIGSMAVSASQTLNTERVMNLSNIELQKFYDGTYTNNGIVLFVDTQTNDEYAYASTDNSTSEYRPRFVVQYESSSLDSNFFMFF